jgi:predicted cupin superfamily sugar epimerase
MNAQEIIKHYSMQPLPEEGGYYVETYRAGETIDAAALPSRYSGGRNHCTSILYLITPESFSKMHRVKSDEIFHFYLGDPVEMLQLKPDGTSEIAIMSPDFRAGHQQQVTVENGIWQGTKLKADGKFALLGCTVSPGFEFQDYETGTCQELTKSHPTPQQLLNQLTN